jgi:hypothetical protein
VKMERRRDEHGNNVYQLSVTELRQAAEHTLE